MTGYVLNEYQTQNTGSNSWGEDGEQYKPPLLSPWSKIELGWLEPVTISSSGKVSLQTVLC